VIGPGQPPSRGLLDTSVFIARESGRPLQVDQLPDELAVSVITVAELHAGVLAARDTRTRARRLATVESIAGMSTLGVDALAARIWAEMRVHLAETGRRARLGVCWPAWAAACQRRAGLAAVRTVTLPASS
jgi:predicted nucleic acid-binding protein